jgi:hypothetical protein
MARKRPRRAGSSSGKVPTRGASKSRTTPRVLRKAPPVKQRGVESNVPRPRDLSRRQLAAKDRSLEALGKMRREGWSFRKAADWAGVDRRTARKYLGSALLKPERKGRELRAAKGDRITRILRFAGADGTFDYKQVRGSKAASELSNYFKELRAALRDRKLTELEARWKGHKISGREVLADAAKIQQLADAGLLKFETLYKQARGGRK